MWVFLCLLPNCFLDQGSLLTNLNLFTHLWDEANTDFMK